MVARPAAARRIDLAQWACEHFYVIADVTPRLPRETPSFVAPEDLFYGREEVGGMMVGFFDENAKTIDAAALPEPFAFTLFPPGWDKIAPYFEKATRSSRPWRRRRSAASSTGRSFTPDDVPLIGPVAGSMVSIVCTAMNSGGVTYSAAAGHMVADFSAGATPRFDSAAFAPERFGERAKDLAWLRARYRASSAGAIGRRTCSRPTSFRTAGPPSSPSPDTIQAWSARRTFRALRPV